MRRSLQVWKQLAWVTLLAGLSASSAPARDEPAEVRVTVREPGSGTTVRGRFDMVRLAGAAQTGAASGFDVLLVIDVSGSTNRPSGIDVDGDGEIGAKGDEPLIPGMPRTDNTDPGDSILAAEITAAGRLLEILDSEMVRVGVVSFSGLAHPVTLLADPSEPSATVDQPLTTDFEAV